VYVRVTRSHYDPAQVKQEDALAVGEAVAAAVKALPGFVSYQSGVDWETGAVIAISTWRDKESANFSRDALGAVISQWTNLGARMEPPAIYEITATA
jgi:quinol monooxygenase YgiN